ncbi:hypothetical protein [Thiohalophilus sp.]|uniref:hypothetical protein n=1 Tax=Thiohalophilus sp. TaxID=3028392 RepID=UPI002ACED292|nr:hypothetical protein [Thiohalophilus sp.]MDZ7803590.1 hypothetical protein [Thiohalophilus sp.]
MHSWRQFRWHNLTRVLLLLVLLGQSALLLHESEHARDFAGESECQLCLHAQPNMNAVHSAPVLNVCFERRGILAPSVEQPVYFSPVYANSSRGPPRA